MSQTPSPRRAALFLLDQVLKRRRPLDEALDGSSEFNALEARDRAFAHMLVLTTLRRLGQIDALLAQIMAKPLPARRHAVKDVLRLGVAQLVFLYTPAHAAVGTAATLAGEIAPDTFVSVVNAVLRRLAHEGKALAAAQDAARLNTPLWLWQALVEGYGEAGARAIGQAHLSEPPLDLSCRDDAALWVERLGGIRLANGMIRLAARPAVETLQGFRDGAWWVQDAAAAMPARLLGSLEGKRVIEIGAAPGGKTAQLIAAGAEVIALDRAPARLAILRENLARLGMSATFVQADATAWRPAELVDAVLIDAPCSATGTIRRHPEAPYGRGMADAERLAATQDALIAAGARFLKPGGRLVFATCSLLPLEGEARIDAALAGPLGLARDPITSVESSDFSFAVTPRGEFRTLPSHWADQGGLDGFFAARLRRQA